MNFVKPSRFQLTAYATCMLTHLTDNDYWSILEFIKLYDTLINIAKRDIQRTNYVPGAELFSIANIQHERIVPVNQVDQRVRGDLVTPTLAFVDQKCKDQGNKQPYQQKMITDKLKYLLYHGLSSLLCCSQVNQRPLATAGIKISREVYTKGRKIHFPRTRPKNS